jgi:hypothetical protein
MGDRIFMSVPDGPYWKAKEEREHAPWVCYDHDCRKHAPTDPECNHGADGCTVRRLDARART